MRCYTRVQPTWPRAARAGDPARPQRHSGHDRLQVPEHDELARLVGIDASALQVEELGLVDRADGAGMSDAPAVGLVDLEARDRHRPSLPGQQHAELAKVAVRPVGWHIDRRKALHVGPRAVREGALREQVAGRVPAGVARVGRQVEELIGRPKMISACSTVEPSPSRVLSMRLRIIRHPSWARAQRRSAPCRATAERCWKATGRERSPAARQTRASTRRQLDLGRSGEESLGLEAARRPPKSSQRDDELLLHDGGPRRRPQPR